MTTKNKKTEVINIDTSTYYQHEQWFKVADVVYLKTDGVVKDEIHAIRIVNSYGICRDVFRDGRYVEIDNGGSQEDPANLGYYISKISHDNT